MEKAILCLGMRTQIKKINYMEDIDNIYKEKLKELNSYIDLSNIDEELEKQFFTYTISCSVADYIARYIQPDIVCGFSMGLYAALYISQSIDFKTGIDIIKISCEEVKKVTSSKYSLYSVFGIPKDKLLSLVNEINVENGIFDMEIVNQLSMFNHVLFCNEIKIEKLKAHSMIKKLDIAYPYHFKYILNNNEFIDNLRARLNFNTSIEQAKYKVLACYKNEPITEVVEIYDAIIDNLVNNISLHNSITYMKDLGIKEIYISDIDNNLENQIKFGHRDVCFYEGRNICQLLKQ